MTNIYSILLIKTANYNAGSRPLNKGGGRSPKKPLDKGGGGLQKKMLSSLRASVWSKNKGGPGLPGPSPGSVTELSERLEQAPVTLNKIRDCSQSRLYVLLGSAECTSTIKTPALPCTIFFYGIIFAIWSSLSGTSSRLFFSEIVSNYPIFPQVFCHKIMT